LRIGEVSPEVVEVLDHCTWLEHASKGAFDIRPYGLEGPIDPSGFVKGWATERAAGRLRSAGLHNWYVSVGGDIVVSGRPSPDRRWSVGIVDPFDDTQIRATFEVEHGAVATSGTSARGQHIWDPRTHQPAASYASMTVVGPSLAWADAFATTAFVMGAEGLDWVHRFAGYVAWAVRPDGTTDTLDADDERLQRASAHRR